MNLSSRYLMSRGGLSLLGKLFQSSGEGIMLFDQNGIIVSMNLRAEEMFGYHEAELLGQPVEVLVPIEVYTKHVKDREYYMKHPISRPMGQGMDFNGRKKNGFIFPVEISLNYFTHENEVVIVSFITDITIRKKNESVVKKQQRQLKEYATELERRVKERTSELEHMNMGLQTQIQERKLAEEALKKSLMDLKKAEKKIIMSLEKEKELGEFKSRFISMASHEFRTPLTAILSSANLLNKYTKTEQHAHREKHVERIKKSVQNVTSILNDFLSLEKLERDSYHTEKKNINIQKLIEEVVEEMQPLLKKGQYIRSKIDSFIIHTDDHILKNILINLLSNASKYSLENKPITIESKCQKDRLMLSVQDRGIGIPKEDQKNLFQCFFRARNAIHIQGTGLGLNIVSKYIELINGRINFISEENQGSTFTILLPI